MKSNKNYLRRLSFILCFAFIIVTINIFSKNANATVFDKPHFTMSIDSISPSPAKVGEDINIKGTITPQDFENVIQKKQIVLVIDVSGSMEGTKITNLKTAAKNFVTKMSTVSNTEISIIAFSDKGTINPYLNGYNDSFVPLINSNVEKIKNCIQSLNANGATNTGDGLRNAAYLLAKNSESASKTIVFMSDGEPTKYVRSNAEKGWVWGTYTGNYIYNSSGDKYAWNESYLPSGYYWGYGTFNGYKYGYTYYTNIKSAGFDLNVGTYGPGSSDDNDGNCLNYAKVIGQIIKDKGYNVFSIGYGLNQSGTTKMKAIHSSMSNNINNYFATDTGAIDGVYNAIADKIINSYTLDNLAIDLNLSSDFTLNYGDNIVNIQNITYTRNTNIIDKIVYHAEPIPFQFTIKGNKQVKDYNVLQGAKLIVPWNGSEITDTSMPKAEVTIIENDLPKINVHLSKIDVNNQSFTPNQNIIANSGEKIKVTYKIDTDPFEYNINNSIGGMIDEAVFVVDLSKNMGTGNRWQMMQNWFTNILLNGNQTIKLGVVGYNEDVIHPIYNGEYDRLFNRNNSTERETLRRFLQEPNSTQHESIYLEDNSNRNIGPALKKADYLLQFKGESNKNKAIVLVNSGDVSYSQSDIDTIKNKGYMVISVDLSCDKNQNTTSNLKTLHSSLLGNNNDYFVSRNDGDNFNFTQVEMQKIADRLKSGMASRELIVTGAQLNFDLGENFESTANSGLDGAGKIRTISLPDIKYTLVKDYSGKYKWIQNDPNPIEVSFEVEAVKGKTGQLGFANDSATDSPEALKNYISYDRFDGTLIKKHIETPVITVLGQVPKINAKVVNQPSNAGIFQEISLMYQITAEKFSANLIPVNQEKQNTYTFSTTLKFHTGGKFEGISGFKSNSSDGWYDLESMPFEVKYKLVNDIYVPDTISNIPLTIKAKASGNLTFGNIESETATSSKFPGAVSYTDLFKNQILNRIEPFNLKVSQAVDHGIYQGIDNGELSVISHSVELPRGTIANLAIGSHIVSSDATITLQVNRNVDIISNNNPIKIYKIVDGRLSLIYGATYTPQGSSGDYNNYTINLPAGINSETKLVIMYQSKIPESGSSGPFINKVAINGVEREFTLNISANQSPDLF